MKPNGKAVVNGLFSLSIEIDAANSDYASVAEWYTDIMDKRLHWLITERDTEVNVGFVLKELRGLRQKFVLVEKWLLDRSADCVSQLEHGKPIYLGVLQKLAVRCVDKAKWQAVRDRVVANREKVRAKSAEEL